MEDDLNVDLDQIENNADKQLQAKNRFQQLANDKRTLAQEKEVLEAKNKEIEAKSLQLEKQAEFYKTFNQVSSKYPEATNYQDKIKEKVEQGYDLEDATVSVLNKEGKLSGGPITPVRPQAEGGSAVTNVSEGDKSLNEMSMGDKLEALKELERSGELAQALRAGINRS